MLDRHELILVEHVRGPRDVTGDEDVVGHHAVDVEGAAARVAGYPPEAGRQFGAFQPFDIADRAQRRHDDVDVERGAVGELCAPHVSVCVSFERLHRNPGTQVDPGVTLHLGGDVTDHTAERADQRCAGPLRDGHVQPEIAADRCHFGADEARTDDQHPLRLGFERRLYFGRVIAGAQVYRPFSFASSGLNHARDRTPVAISNRS